MEPLDKDENFVTSPTQTTSIKKDPIKEPAKKIKMEVTPAMPKHNNLLIVLACVLFVVVAAFGALMVYQKQGNNFGTSDKTTTETNATSDETGTTTASSEDKLDTTVSANIDDEISNFDSSMNSLSDTTYSNTTLSDSSLGTE